MLSASLSSDSSPRSRLLAKPRARTNACACGSRSRRRRDDNKPWKRCEALRREKSHSNRWIPTAEMGRRTHHRTPPPKKRAPPPILRPGLDHVAALAEGREAGVGVVRGVVIAVCDGQIRPGPAVEDVGFCRDPEPAAPVHRATGRLQRPTSDHPATIAEGVDHPRPYDRPYGRPSPYGSLPPAPTGSHPRAGASRWG